jgi:chitin synthase
MISTTEDDIWGQEIGGYDEHGAQFPPPPQTLLSPEGNVLATATIVGKDELEAMLDEGWDDDAPPPLPSPGGRPPLLNPHAQSSPRFQLSDAPPPLRGFANPNPYTPLAREPSPATPRNYPTPDTPTIPVNPNNGMSSAVEPGGWRTHAKRRSSGSRPPGPEQQNSYGPLGPLDPGPPPLPRTGKKF